MDDGRRTMDDVPVSSIIYRLSSDRCTADQASKLRPIKGLLCGGPGAMRSRGGELSTILVAPKVKVRRSLLSGLSSARVNRASSVQTPPHRAADRRRCAPHLSHHRRWL